VDPITAAIAAGAAAGLTEISSQVVKDAYSALESALRSRFPRIDPGPLEERPGSQAKQLSLAEDLAQAGADRDAELLRLARAVVEAVQRDAPQAAASVGVDLERVRAEAIRIEGVQGGQTGVRGRDWDVEKDITIRGAGGGGGRHPKR